MAMHFFRLEYLNQSASTSPSQPWLSAQVQIGAKDARHSMKMDLAMRLSDFVMDNMTKTNPIQDRFLFSLFVKKDHISKN